MRRFQFALGLVAWLVMVSCDRRAPDQTEPSASGQTSAQATASVAATPREPVPAGEVDALTPEERKLIEDYLEASDAVDDEEEERRADPKTVARCELTCSRVGKLPGVAEGDPPPHWPEDRRVEARIEKCTSLCLRAGLDESWSACVAKAQDQADYTDCTIAQIGKE